MTPPDPGGDAATPHPSDDPPREPRKIPPHKPGSLTGYARGCTEHPECRADQGREAARTAKARQRAERRDRLVRIPQLLLDGVTVEMRWVAPGLAPHWSDNPARHGTVYGRREFYCDCPRCEIARRKPVTTPDDEDE